MTLVELPCDSRLASSVLGGPFDSLVNVMLYVSCAPKLYCLVPLILLDTLCIILSSEDLFSVVWFAIGGSMNKGLFIMLAIVKLLSIICNLCTFA